MFITDTERELKKKHEAAMQNERTYFIRKLHDLKEEEIVHFVSKDITGRLLNSRVFQIGIMTVIIANSLMIAIETNKKLVSLERVVILILIQERRKHSRGKGEGQHAFKDIYLCLDIAK